jgi:hypothetical protein
MKNLLKLNFKGAEALKRGRGSSVLGLTLDGGKLDGVVLRRTNGSLQPQQTFSLSLSLDPLTNDPALVGREIRNQLDAAGVRERSCVFGLPLKWALTTHVLIPEMDGEDEASFLQIEAERSFPCDLQSLLLATSRYVTRAGQKHATLVGMPRNHVEALEKALRAAQLKPLSFSLALPALQPAAPDSSNGVLALTLGETHVGLQLTYAGGVAALRTLEGAIEMEGGNRRVKGDLVTREARITLGQLPEEIRQSVRRVRIFGPRESAQQLADEIELRLESMDLQVELAAQYASGEFEAQLPAGTPVSGALSLAARRVAGNGTGFEFLPPKVTPWQQFSARYSSGRLQRVGLVAAVVFVLMGGAFGVQQWQIWRLESEWGRMKKTVGEVELLKTKWRQYRPWYDESLRGLTIISKLTEAFPEDGTVTAKTLELRDLTTVTCTGVARDYTALLRTVERLRAVSQARDVSLGQTRGQSPALQFTLSFVWNEGPSNAN